MHGRDRHLVGVETGRTAGAAAHSLGRPC
jgi:hypothetical protein